MNQLNPTWDLDVFFTGGSDSQQFAAYLTQIREDLVSLGSQLDQSSVPQTASEGLRLVPLVNLMQSILMKLSESAAFTSCLTAQNQQDKKAVRLAGTVASIRAEVMSAWTRLDHLWIQISDEVWNAMMEQDEWKGISFYINERRTQAMEKLPPEQEALTHDLAVDGYHGWSRLYDTIVSRVHIPYEENGQSVSLSAGQAFNKLHQSDREARARLFGDWEAAWGDQADFCADALNHLAGFRLQLYKHRGWQSVHQEPLAINRMSQRTLDVMWDTIERNKAIFVQYLQRKARLLGRQKLDWHDVDAPVGSINKTYSYDEGAAIIVDQFRRFSPQMADFAVHALENRWIEAEDRPGKRPGGFCTSFPASGQTRIFMTYAGTADNVSTLAHELGHAYHQHVMRDLPILAQRYAMNVAETASTFAEMVVSDAALKQAVDPAEKQALLEDKIQRSIAFFMNIHARFMFETEFYVERQQGMVSVERLNELMVTAQQRAYGNSLGMYHPHFWASKLHFYITGVPFYNFPYTFGYLFSAGIYAAALGEGKSFEERYIALLRDTGRMQVEDLAWKHLGVRLEEPDFWQQAIDLCVADVQQYLAMTE
ncbi:M3 family oligoendopeptidase [Paenibacillus sp. J2TS4]|uniref:M3 family oligoendopeptidase n=1 Tax=Paenibacillus sp. J2TS4 TaxID=2807194 RepID=UPI001B12F039|nr:oligoendopeptidase [Paenibacillus sp. J2TS4]